MTDMIASNGPIKSGRPRSKNETLPRYWETDLYAVLSAALPQHVVGGRLEPTRIAEAIGKHKFTVYKWLQNNRITSNGAKLLIDESYGKLTPTDLARFVIS